MNEKDCPIKLPVKLFRDHTDVGVQDSRGIIISEGLKRKEADFICLACNSYFEMREALEFAKAPSAAFSTDQLTFANRIILAIKEKAKATLKGDANEQSD